nr:hypothetical protein [Tanacetum cinerariifolium]
MFGVKLLGSLSGNRRRDAGLAMYMMLYKDYAKNHDTLFSRRISEIEAFLVSGNISEVIGRSFNKDADIPLRLPESRGLCVKQQHDIEKQAICIRAMDVLATLNSKEMKKRTEGIKEEAGDRLYVKGRSDHSECHLKRDCLMKKSSGFVKKGKRDQDSDSSDDEGNAYFGEALVVVGNDEMTELVMDSGRSNHMTHMMDFLYDFKVDDGGLCDTREIFKF